MSKKTAFYCTDDGEKIPLNYLGQDDSAHFALSLPNHEVIYVDETDDWRDFNERKVFRSYSSLSDGKLILCHVNGNVIREERVENGMANGLSLESDSEGILSKEFWMKDGERNGAFKLYNTISKKNVLKGTYKDGKLDGPMLGYSARDGKTLRLSANFVEGQEDGRQIVIDNGIVETHYYKDGKEIPQLVWAACENFNDIINGDFKSVAKRILGISKREQLNIK